jgi:anti-sigma B factor antagonist
MGAAFDIQERRRGAVTVLALSGRLVAFESDEVFKDRVVTLVRAGQRDVLIDMSRVTYIDSGGVGVLVGTLLHVLRRGGRLKLLSPSDRVARVLGITGLQAVFETFDREEDAVASFAHAPLAEPGSKGTYDAGQ